VLTDAQPVNAVCNPAIFARLLDSRAKVCVLQIDAVLVAARGIDNLPGRDRIVSINPVALSPTVCGGRVGDLLAVAV